MHRSVKLSVCAIVLAVVVSACGTSSTDSAKKTSITLVTHDSFAVSKPLLAAFERKSGIHVKVVQNGDAGAVLNQVVLTKDHPLGDVFFGIDNTLLTRGLDAKIFSPYTSPDLSQVDPRYDLDKTRHVTPIDHGDVCINYDKAKFSASHPAPSTLEQLTDVAYKDQLVVENPATSSPGLAFLLATQKHFGSSWLSYWKDLRHNGVKVASGWEEAYDSDFSAGAGHGDRPIVVSYASSPPAEVYFADPHPSVAPTAVMTSSCFSQVEFAGVLRGTRHEKAAQTFIDFLLSKQVQEDVPLQMFVFPVRTDASLPAVFTKFAETPKNALTLSPAVIGKNRDAWIDAWDKTVVQ